MAARAMDKANDLLFQAKSDPSLIKQDSGVIFLSWLGFALAHDPHTSLVVLIAVCFNVFFGVDIAEWGLPDDVARAIETFVPTIKKNRKNRENGPKGAVGGVKGGRPRSSKNPGGVIVETPSDSATETETETANVSVPVSVSSWQAASPTDIKHKIYYAVLAVFFFANLRNPTRQTLKMLGYYSAADWALKDVDDEQKLAFWVDHAHRWQVNDDTLDRFRASDLNMWSELFVMAPDEIKERMIVGRIHFIQDHVTATIACDSDVIQWVLNNPSAFALVKKWSEGHQLKWRTVDNLN